VGSLGAALVVGLGKCHLHFPASLEERVVEHHLQDRAHKARRAHVANSAGGACRVHVAASPVGVPAAHQDALHATKKRSGHSFVLGGEQIGRVVGAAAGAGAGAAAIGVKGR